MGSEKTNKPERTLLKTRAILNKIAYKFPN